MGIAKIQGLGLLLLIGLGALVMFLVYNDLIDVHKDNLLCYGGKRYYNVGDKLVLFSIGSIRIKYQPTEWGCPLERRYDGSKYKVINGELQGK